MLPHEHADNLNGCPVTLGDSFTEEEVSRLTELRAGYHAHVEYLEHVLDERRLEFARWLLDHGKLSEACAELEGSA